MTDSPVDPLQVATLVGALLESIGVRYSIGGSFASSFSGEPRATLDIDIVVALAESQVEALMAALQAEFYVDGRALIRAIHARSSANIVHLPSSVKVDLFVAGGSAIDTDVLNRRVRIALGHRAGDAVWVHTPEDILLLKLWWFRRGGEVSDRQWRDVLSIVRVQGTRLDHRYLEAGAARLQVSDLLTRVLSQEAGR